MKLGFKIRKIAIKIESTIRIILLWLDYFIWLIISGDKFVRKPKKIKKVLVVDTSKLGDNLNTYCILKKLEKNYKAIDFYYFTSQAFADMIKQSNVIGLKEHIKIKNLKFDIIIFITGKPLLFSKLFYGISNFTVGGMIVGIKSIFGNNLFFSRRIFPKYIHKIRERFKVFELAGFKFNDYYLELLYSKNYSKEAEKLIKDLKINKDKKIVFFNLTDCVIKDDFFPRKWDNFHKLANLLKDYKILITGTKKEELLAKKIIKKTIHKDIHSICGKTSFLGLGELMRIVKDRGVLVCVDTGTTHLGSAVGIKVINLMSQYPKRFYYAWNNNNITLYPASSVCRGCRRIVSCPEKNPICINSITAKDVKNAFNKLMVEK